MKRVAINGFGRIGRAALKIILEAPELEVVAINDLMHIDNAAYLLNYDSVYGKYKDAVIVQDNHLQIHDKKILYLSEKDPANLPWKKLDIDVVIESTGIFTDKENAEKHIYSGAKKVIISGPTKSKNIPTVLFGVNTESGKTAVFSCASCTTNNIAPIMEIIDRRIGIKKAVLNTVHAYTASQSIVDSPSKKAFKMGRGGAVNLIPTTTGAAIATVRVLPQFENKFDGISIRTPVAVGCISDITFIAERDTSVEEINHILLHESEMDQYKDVVLFSHEPLVSSDIIQSPYAAIIDGEMTKVVDGNLVKILAWYDNEWGFTNQMIRQIRETG